MQEARVVGVFDVFEVELPAALQHLSVAAEDLYRLLHHAADSCRDLGTDVALERRRLLRDRRGHQAAEALDAASSRPPARLVGGPGPAALPLRGTPDPPP